MVEIPDSLRSVFSATLRQRDGEYVVEIPSREITHDAVSPGGTYRVAIFDSPETAEDGEQDSKPSERSQRTSQRGPPEPPVEEGEVRDVTIETVGDQGDGIAKVDRGYVVIVPDAQPGDEPTVKIEQVQENVAFASIVDPDPRTL
jgi:predicted RNA-binding protein with TRAM domain